MSASDSNMSFRQRLLELIDSSGVSDRRLSLLATGSADTVRNLRRGSSPRLDSLKASAASSASGSRWRLSMSPPSHPREPRLLRSGLNGPGGSGRKSARTWSRSSPRPAKGAPDRTDRSRTTGETNPRRYRSSRPTNLPYRANRRLFFPPIRLTILGSPQREPGASQSKRRPPQHKILDRGLWCRQGLSDGARLLWFEGPPEVARLDRPGRRRPLRPSAPARPSPPP